MANPSPLREHFDQQQAVMMPYGDAVRIVAEVTTHEVEYAAIRKGVGVMDCPHRGLIRLTGRDRNDFLHRLTTHDCRSMTPGDVRRMFILNAKGRIMADLIVAQGEGHTLIDLDVYQAPVIAAELEKLLFGEDVKIENLSSSHHRLSAHGPRAKQAVEGWLGVAAEHVYGYDEVGESGRHAWLAAERVAEAYAGRDAIAEELGLKELGWLGYNLARVEAGRAMFHIDFGTDTLPHETGPAVLGEAVSFTKGCYRGQEIVARMQSLGHPSKQLVGFRVEGAGLPASGTAVKDGPGADAAVVGAVTSSAHAPLLSQAGIGMAMVKWGRHEIGTTLYAPADGRSVAITVAAMPFVRRATPT